MTTNEDVFAALSAAEVDFVVVGGVAVVLHGHPRLTVDMDIVLDLAEEPALRAMRALSQLGLEPTVPVAPEAFADAEMLRDAKVVMVDGVNVRVASIDHLIAMKRAAGRAKDFADIEELERLRDG